MKKVIIIILLFSSICFGDVLDSHLTPRTDSRLDVGSALLLWRFIYGDAFTDGMALWEDSELSGFNSMTSDIFTDGTALWSGSDLTGFNLITATDIVADNDLTGETITGTTITDGIFVVSGGEISAGEIINTFGDIDVGGNSVTARNLYAWGGSSEMHTTDDPQLTLTHTAGVDYAEFYVNSFGDLSIIATGGDISFGDEDLTTTGTITADGSTFGDGGTTDYTEFSTQGAMFMHGNARVARHMVIGAASWKIGAGAPTASFENIYPTLLFNDGRDDAAHYGTHVPYRWDDTTDMEVEVHWRHDTVAKTGKVLWNLNYIGAKEGENPAGAGTLISQLSAGNHPQDEILVTTFGTDMLAANLERMDNLGLKVWRNGDDGTDLLTENAELIAMHIHYTMNQLGDPLLAPVTDVLLLDDGASRLLLDDGASFMLIRI